MAQIIPFPAVTPPEPRVSPQAHIRHARQSLVDMPAILADDPRMVRLFCLFQLKWLEDRLSSNGG